MNKIIASIGLTNNSSLNIFEVNEDYGTITCGFNATTLDECEEYEIRYDNDEDDEFESPYIVINDIKYFTAEMIRTNI